MNSQDIEQRVLTVLENDDFMQRLQATAELRDGAPAEALEALVSLLNSPEEVEAMPVEQAVGLWMTEPYVQERDRLCQWFYLPYWQAREGARQAEQDYERECEKVEMQDAPLSSGAAEAVTKRVQGSGFRIVNKPLYRMRARRAHVTR